MLRRKENVTAGIEPRLSIFRQYTMPPELLWLLATFHTHVQLTLLNKTTNKNKHESLHFLYLLAYTRVVCTCCMTGCVCRTCCSSSPKQNPASVSKLWTPGCQYHKGVAIALAARTKHLLLIPLLFATERKTINL